VSEIENNVILKIPDFTYDINPGLYVRNAFITKEEISIEESIFSDSQYVLIDKMMTMEIEKQQTTHREQLESEKRTAWQNGNQAGIKQTQNQMLCQVQTVVDQLQHLIENLTLLSDTYREYFETEALKLIVKIARKVIDVEISMNPQIILSTLKKSFEFLNEKEEIRIMVNPDDWEIVNENIKKLSLNISLPENIEILSNQGIASGGCKIDFKAGSIDADIDTQFEEIKRQVFKDA